MSSEQWVCPLSNNILHPADWISQSLRSIIDIVPQLLSTSNVNKLHDVEFLLMWLLSLWEEPHLLLKDNLKKRLTHCKQRLYNSAAAEAKKKIEF